MSSGSGVPVIPVCASSTLCWASAESTGFTSRLMQILGKETRHCVFAAVWQTRLISRGLPEARQYYYIFFLRIGNVGHVGFGSRWTKKRILPTHEGTYREMVCLDARTEISESDSPASQDKNTTLLYEVPYCMSGKSAPSSNP
jgi:hypothetical protein